MSKSFYVLTFLTAIVIMIAVPLGLFYVSIYYNVRGIQDTYGDKIKNIPVLNLALKTKEESERAKLSKMTKKELIEAYLKLKTEKDQLEAKIKTKDIEIKKLKKVNADMKKLETKNTSLGDENQKLKDDMTKTEENYQKKMEELAKEKKDIDNLIATGDKEGFKKYFEKIDSKTATEIYNSLKKEEISNDEAKKFAQTYDEMDSTAVASIFETLGDSKIKLVTDIIKNMDRDKVAEVLAAMNKTFAATITEKLANDYIYY